MDIICSSASAPTPLSESIESRCHFGKAESDLGVFVSRFYYCFCFVLYFSVGNEKRERQKVSEASAIERIFLFF